MTEPHSPDHSTGSTGKGPAGDDGAYRSDERLVVPWWWWLAAAVLWSAGRVRISVTADGELQANRARLPRSVIARGASIPASAKSAALGRQLDPAAFLVHRAWVKTMILVVLDDPDDPTPYWLVSTRHPAELLAALGIPDAAATPPADSGRTDSGPADSGPAD